MKRQTFTYLALATVVTLFGACSSFDTQWKTAGRDTKATRWEGRWTSEKHHALNGSPMGGRLRCILEPADADRLTAHFRANWLLFASDYSVTLNPARSGPVARRAEIREYRGSHELPAMYGGVYRYTARIGDDRFVAHYDSSYDHGNFALQRVRMSKDCFPPHARD